MANLSFFIGICGGTGSGKTFLAGSLVRALGKDKAVCLSQDAYYRDLSHISADERGKINFDHPDALDTGLMVAHLKALGRGETIRMPVYDFNTHTRVGDQKVVIPRRFIFIEGILILSVEAVAACLDYTLFLDVPPDVRFIRRLKRDMAERGRTAEAVADQYLDQVRPMHERFVKPRRQSADFVIPGTYDIRDVLDRILAAAS
ncbi:MAG: uridine kinase [Desulfobacterales bacterium]|nr:uridine kinase [Desulfobacterales bacterium]